MVRRGRRGGPHVKSSKKPSPTSGLITVAAEGRHFSLHRARRNRTPPPWENRKRPTNLRRQHGGHRVSAAGPGRRGACARAHGPAPPPRRPASLAHRTLGRPGRAARRLVASWARLLLIDSARAAAARSPPPPPVWSALPPRVGPAAARGLRVCQPRHRPASAMDLFGDLPEPERSPRPAAGKRAAAGPARGRRAGGVATAWRPAVPEAGGRGGGRASAARAGPGRGLGSGSASAMFAA